jgi:hypothetical protein
MTGMHGGHALIETLAAIVLCLGGAVIVLQAWFDRGRPDDRIWPVRETPPSPTWLTTALIAVLSGSAAAIHLAAGPQHVEELGDIGLGFYWAALFQAGFAVAWLASARSRRLALVGIAGNAALTALWALSRTTGLPFLPGVEPIGVADAVCVALEIGLVALLGVALRDPVPVWGGGRSMGLGTTGLIAIAGVAVLATAIAVVDVNAGHHGGGNAPPAAHVATP